MKKRWGLSFTDPRLVRRPTLYASPGVPAGEGSYPNKGLCSAVRGIFQLFGLWGLFFALGCCLRHPGHETFHLLCFTLAKRSMAVAMLIDSGIYIFHTAFEVIIILLLQFPCSCFSSKYLVLLSRCCIYVFIQSLSGL